MRALLESRQIPSWNVARRYQANHGMSRGLLADHAAGRPEALGELFRTVYAELLALAHSQRRRLGAGQTLDTVALVHDCYLKLAGGAGVPARDRGHFFALAARAMRHLLVDYARSRLRAKRRGEIASLDPDALGVDSRIETVLAVHQALDRLMEIDPRLVAVTGGGRRGASERRRIPSQENRSCRESGSRS